MTHALTWHESGYKVFPLHPIVKGRCKCGGTKCAGKHPAMSNWQHTPHWSDEKLEELDLTNYGILCDGLLVIDVDARNGGVESFAKLQERLPSVMSSGCVVNTGSGNGSQHYFFKLPDTDTPLRQHIDELPGIDFKSTGFVVGCGSMHASGNAYTIALGSPMEIEGAPADLIELLHVPKAVRAQMDGGFSVDVSHEQVQEILDLIDPDVTYDDWVRVGMGLHHTFGGGQTGLDMWDCWSSNGAKYKPDECDHKWQTFGKRENPVRLGTLIKLAGWHPPVEFDVSAEALRELCASDAAEVDILRPHGVVGQLADWINKTSLYRREALAVQAALFMVACCGGLRHKFGPYGTRCNVMMFGVSGSGTGKGHIISSIHKVLTEVGVMPAVVGKIKSEQEITRALLRHQAFYPVIDELGIFLSKISSSKESYHAGMVGEIMQVFTEADGTHTVSHDVKEAVEERMQKRIAALNKRLDQGDECEAELNRAIEDLEALANGIVEPFMCMFGITTPDKFDPLVTTDNISNGFFARANIMKEHEDNPEKQAKASAPPPDGAIMTLQNLYRGGHFDMADKRVKRHGDIVPIDATPEAMDLLEEAYRYYHEKGEDYKERSSLCAITRRCLEQVIKISMIMGMENGIIGTSDVQYARALIDADLQFRTHLANANSDDMADAFLSRIVSSTPTDAPIGYGALKQRVLKGRFKDRTADDLDAALQQLCNIGMLAESTTQRGARAFILKG